MINTITVKSLEILDEPLIRVSLRCLTYMIGTLNIPEWEYISIIYADKQEFFFVGWLIEPPNEPPYCVSHKLYSAYIASKRTHELTLLPFDKG